MKIQFCGAARTVTGSCHYVDTGHVKFVVDCGMFQGEDEIEKNNFEPFPFNPADLDYIFLTHAHFDHTGRLPLLVKQGFRGRIICTKPTRELAKIVLLDAARIQSEDFNRYEAHLKDDNGNMRNPSSHGARYEVAEPLYTEDEVLDIFQYFEVYPYGDAVKLNDNIEFRMRDAGHILGSAIMELWVKNESGRTRKIVFSGDIGQPGARIIRDPDMVREADYVIVESTYGDRLHKNKDESVLEFLSVLKMSQETQSNVLIPTFAIERAQELIYELNLFYENNLMAGTEVFLDSPMALHAIEVFKKYPDFYDEDARRLIENGDNPFEFEGLTLISTADESKRLIAKRGFIVLAGSGMCTGGRIVHHLANNLADRNAHVVFMGYQVKGTLGRRIVDGEPRVRIRGKEVDVHANVHTIGGFSAHADERDLKYWLRSFGHTPRMIFMVHGEEPTAVAFANNVKEELNIDTHAPRLYEEVELD